MRAQRSAHDISAPLFRCTLDDATPVEAIVIDPLVPFWIAHRVIARPGMIDRRRLFDLQGQEFFHMGRQLPPPGKPVTLGFRTRPFSIPLTLLRTPVPRRQRLPFVQFP